MPNAQQPINFINSPSLDKLILRWIAYLDMPDTNNFWKECVFLNIPCDQIGYSNFLSDVADLFMARAFFRKDSSVTISIVHESGEMLSEPIQSEQYVEYLDAMIMSFTPDYCDFLPDELIALFSTPILSGKYETMFGKAYTLLFPLVMTQQWQTIKEIFTALSNAYSEDNEYGYTRFEQLVLHQTETMRNILHCLADFQLGFFEGQALLEGDKRNQAIQECTAVLKKLASLSEDGNLEQPSLLSKLLAQTDRADNSPFHVMFAQEFYAPSLHAPLCFANTGFGLALTKALEDEPNSAFITKNEQDHTPYDLLQTILNRLYNYSVEHPNVRIKSPELHSLFEYLKRCCNANDNNVMQAHRVSYGLSR